MMWIFLFKEMYDLSRWFPTVKEIFRQFWKFFFVEEFEVFTFKKLTLKCFLHVYVYAGSPCWNTKGILKVSVAACVYKPKAQGSQIIASSHRIICRNVFFGTQVTNTRSVKICKLGALLKWIMWPVILIVNTKFYIKTMHVKKLTNRFKRETLYPL